MVTNAGGGYSRWKDIAVTRWREDTTCDNWGTFCFLRDVASGQFWSTAYQPTREPCEEYEAIFSEARAEFRQVLNQWKSADPALDGFVRQAQRGLASLGEG
jgi:cellobiose phosphorylase